MLAGLSRNLTCEDRPSLVQTQAGVQAGEAPPLPVVGATVAPRHVLLLLTPPCFFTISFFLSRQWEVKVTQFCQELVNIFE